MEFLIDSQKRSVEKLLRFNCLSAVSIHKLQLIMPITSNKLRVYIKSCKLRATKIIPFFTSCKISDNFPIIVPENLKMFTVKLSFTIKF